MKTNRYIKAIIGAALCAASAPCGLSAAGPGIRVEHLGTDNTIVRVAPDAARYLMLPVQESSGDATVNVFADGRLDRTVYVRLARSKSDYTVPFDLAPYKGREVILDIVTPQGRSSVREAKGDACWAEMTLADSVDTSNTERFRPAYHHTPLYGWMNDPNGMFYRDGQWHLFYQWNPYGSKWQNMTWGHSTSPDLVHWKHHGPAIEPDGLGSIFSGSCAIDSAGTAGFGPGAVVALYTSASASQKQSMAWSTDGGDTFTKYRGNPVLTLETEARDPNMFWHAPTGRWIMTLAHALEHEMLIYSSPDLKEWTLESRFGKGLGAQDGVWECPDLFELPVDGSDRTKWVLLCNINPGGPFGGSATQYFIGDFDGTTFIPDTDADGRVPTKWLDFGKDNYANVSWSDAPGGRRTIIGWMSNWQYAADVPTQQFRSANTLPREVSLFTAPDGQIYAATAPSPETEALRGAVISSARRFKAPEKGRVFTLPASGLCEITLDIDPERAADVRLSLLNDKGESVDMTYDPAAGTFAFDRTRSGDISFSREFPAVTVAPVLSGSKTLGLRLFVDRGSVEVFGNDGRFAMTNLVFPSVPYHRLSVSSASGKAVVSGLKIHTLEP